MAVLRSGVFIRSAQYSRRDFLARTSAGFGALALGALTPLDAGAELRAKPPLIDPLNPYAARPPHFAPRAKSVIFLYMVGGPSQVDTFDHKPALQRLNGQPMPASFRQAIEKSKFANVTHSCEDKLLGSSYAWCRYGESGMWVSELFPQLARQVDKLCFIHSMQADSNNHAPASYQLHTGDIRAGKASLGSWTTYGLGSEKQGLPGYVVLFDSGPLGGAANYSNGFLPATVPPTRLRDKGTPVLDLLPPPEFADGQRASLDLVRELNLQHRRSHGGFTELDARLASYELAYRMQSSALEVGNLDQETTVTKRD